MYTKERKWIWLPRGDQPWVFFGMNDAKAETPILWPPHAKSWLIGKDSDAGRDLGQEEKGTTKDETAGWHHQLDGHEFEWTLGVGDTQGGLACCNSWGRKESDTTERLNWLINPIKKYVLPLCSSLKSIHAHIPHVYSNNRILEYFCTWFFSLLQSDFDGW